MESKFRPIPITILDFLGILLPGFVWLILIITACEIVRSAGGNLLPTPISAWSNISAMVKDTGTWMNLISVLIVSLLLGYIVKPRATRISEKLINLLRKRFKRDGCKTLDDLEFPYPGKYCETPYYQKVKDMLETKLGFSPESLPGNKTFAVARRYLRITSPILWEESERREAEVRMMGAMFLASLFSLALGVITLLLQCIRYLPKQNIRGITGWILISAIFSYVIGINFIKLREDEVGYTYINTLVAYHYQTPAGQHATGAQDVANVQSR